MNDPCIDATSMQHAEIAPQFIAKVTMHWVIRTQNHSKSKSMHILDCRKQLINKKC